MLPYVIAVLLRVDNLSSLISVLSLQLPLCWYCVLQRVYKYKYIMEDMESLLESLSRHLGDFKDASEDVTTLFSQISKASNCDSDIDFSVEKFKKPTKDVLATCLFSAYQNIKCYMRNFLEISNDVVELKSHLIKSQNSVIKLQAELLEVNSKQLDSVQTAVKTAVQDTVQTEMKTYSQAVAKASPSNSPPTFTTENLKKVVQNVVAEEDRSRNVVVFGLTEEAGEKLCDRVSDVFGQINEKPHFEAVRVGNKTADKARPRPVKVSLGNSWTVHQILIKAKELRLSQNHKTVFISPDRSHEERAVHKYLV